MKKYLSMFLSVVLCVFMLNTNTVMAAETQPLIYQTVSRGNSANITISYAGLYGIKAESGNSNQSAAILCKLQAGDKLSVTHTLYNTIIVKIEGHNIIPNSTLLEVGVRGNAYFGDNTNRIVKKVTDIYSGPSSAFDIWLVQQSNLYKDSITNKRVQNVWYNNKQIYLVVYNSTVVFFDYAYRYNNVSVPNYLRYGFDFEEGYR